ncbi:MAG: ribosome-associated translation inhibitor RaiA [Pseudomonadota bacterium]
MSLRISGKHMDVGDALRSRIDSDISAAVEKYFDGGFSGHVTIEKQSGVFETDCALHLDTGMILQARGKEHDPIASFEAAYTRVEKRLRRYKRRLKDHHANAGTSKQEEFAYTVMAAPEEEEEVPTDFSPAVIAETKKKVNTQTVAMAVMQLDLMDEPVHIFRNAGNGTINMVYRRSDGNIGWVDPSSLENGNS